MNYKKLFYIALLSVSLASFNSCQKTDKENISVQTGEYEQKMNVQNEVDSKSDRITNNTVNPNLSSDGTSQPVNYKQQSENFTGIQDKRMIIRSGTMNLEVDKFDDTETKIKDIAGKHSGYITNSSSQLNASGKKQGSITLRVPADKFDAVLSELSKTGKVMNQNISGKDVTEEYMDAEARLKTQRELESRLLKLLSEKTAKLIDIVEVETKLASVREQIEKTEGRMRFLKDQASFSTLTVSVYEPSMLNTSTGGGFFYELGQSVKKGMEGFTKVLSTVITLLIALIPLFLIAWLIYYLIRRVIRKRKLAKATV